MLPYENTPATQSTAAKQNVEQTGLKPLDIVILLVSHWPWILLCLLLSWGVAEYIIVTSRPIYTRNASILIKDVSKTSGLGGGGGFSEAVLSGQSVDLNNEMFMLRSPALMTDVIARLNLQMEYFVEGRFHRGTLYGSSLPITVEMPDAVDNEAFGFTVELKKDSTYILSTLYRNNEEYSDKRLIGKLNSVIKTPIGRICIKPSPFFYVSERPIFVERHSLQSTLAFYVSELNVYSSDNSSIINLSINDHDQQKAEDILYSIIAIYNEMWMKDRNQVSVSTNEFINDRLRVIEDELGNVEGDITSYKSENLILGSAEAVASAYMGQAQTARAQQIELNNQLYMARSVRSYLTNEQTANQLLPSSQGFSDSGIAGQISEYNNLLIRRNNLISASSLQNPLVQDLDVQLNVLRQNLIGTIDAHIQELNLLIRSAQSVQATGNSKVATAPTQSRHLLSFERQQKVKESLYLFLLQKREENELSQAFTAYNNRVVTPPSGSSTPTSPVLFNIYLYCLLAGLLLPITVIILNELANTSVRGRKDLDVLTIPFIGEIPLNNPDNRFVRFFKRLKQRFTIETKSRRHHKEDKTLHLLVKEGKTDIMNEAFRVARTNMEFIAGRSDNARAIMLTSFNPNSGKTFVISNLALSLAIKGQRVLVIDLDMRKRSLSALVGKRLPGLSNYLGGYYDDYHELIKTAPVHEKLDVLPAGKIPPNPTELLFEPRLDEMIKQLREEYDYIFLDCPPLEIVADASIVARLADMSIFVVRAEGLQRTALPDVQKLYDEKRLPKMTVLLNGTTDAFSRYGYHRYGSRYGYSYGYGRSYSYGYGYSDDERESKES